MSDLGSTSLSSNSNNNKDPNQDLSDIENVYESPDDKNSNQLKRQSNGNLPGAVGSICWLNMIPTDDSESTNR